jgi:fucose permease
VGKRRIVTLSVFVFAVSSALFAALPSYGPSPVFLLALVTSAFIGAGAAGMESVGNALIADDNPRNLAFAMNFIHAFFAIGAVAGPVAAGQLLNTGKSWQLVFYGGAALTMLVTLGLATQIKPRNPAQPPQAVSFGFLRSPLLWLLVGVLACYVGAEVGYSAWISPLMEKVLKTDRGTAALPVSVLWGAVLVGRLLVSGLVARIALAPLLVISGLGSAGSIIGAACASSPALCLFWSALNGLFMSGIFALIATDASQSFPGQRAPVFGVITAGVGLGALIVPAGMGSLATATSLRIALLLPAALMLVVAGVYLFRRPEPPMG